MTITVSEDHHVTVAHISGDVDLSNAGEVMERLRAAVSNSAMGLVLDLRETTYLDSVGMALLFETVRRLGRRQQALHLVIERDSFVSDLVAATDFGSYADVHTDLDEAIGDVRALA